TLSGASPALAAAVLEGLTTGWPSDKSPSLGPSEKEVLVRLMEALPELARDRLLALAQRWNQPELFGTSVGAIIAKLKVQVTDGSVADEQRTAAAKRWIGLEDKPEVAAAILQQVTLLTPPGLASGLVNALGESRQERMGEAVTRQWT